ncbi:MAG: type II toxin-antitoxin system prevent-host-death family antitoxin [Microbacterium sp.]|uniref:type II toxin-antitoxin system Phd/YefM family antitoxin n=1 Tax=Microbacterium sp. TaxID=51671 RepID=UPI0039E57256
MLQSRVVQFDGHGATVRITGGRSTGVDAAGARVSRSRELGSPFSGGACGSISGTEHAGSAGLSSAGVDGDGSASSTAAGCANATTPPAGTGSGASHESGYHGQMVAYNVLDARNNLSRLISQARSGVEVVIMNRGVPVAQLTPVGPVDLPFTGDSLADWIDANPLPARLSRPTAEIQADIRALRDAWE